MERHIYFEGVLRKIESTPGITHELRKQRQPALAHLIEQLITGNGSRCLKTGLCSEKVAASEIKPQEMPGCGNIAFRHWEDIHRGGKLRGGAWLYEVKDVKDEATDVCVLYVHGGSFRDFHPQEEGYDWMCSEIVFRTGLMVVCPDTIKSGDGRPHKAPEILAQLLLDLKWLINFDPRTQAARTSPSKVLIMGDSAGACEAASLLHMVARDEPQLLTSICGLVLISAWMDLSCKSVTYISNAYGAGSHNGDPCWPRQANLHWSMSREVALEYLGNQSLLADPVFSPYWASREQGEDLVKTIAEHRIPIFIVQGGSEVLLGEVADYAQRLKDRLPIELWIHEGAFHCFMMYDAPKQWPSKDAAWDQMVKFITRAVQDGSQIKSSINYWIQPWTPSSLFESEYTAS